MAVPIIMGILLQIGVIQNYAVDKVSEFLSRKTATTISVGHVDIGFFNKAILDDVYMADHRGDTLIYASRLKAGVKSVNLLNGNIAMGNVTLSDSKMYIEKDSLGVTNLSKVLEKFKSRKPKPDKKKNDFRLSADEINLVNIHLRMSDPYAPASENGVNFKDLDLRNVYLQAHTLKIINDDIGFKLDHLSFREKSGFYLQHLYALWIQVGSNGIRLNNLRLETPNSTVEFARLNMLYDQWSAFNNFTDDVIFEADIRPSRLAYSAIAEFTRKPTQIPTVIEFEGKLYGPISDIGGELRNVHSRNTYLDLNFRAQGLPDIQNTRFEANLNHLITDGADITAIYAELTGKTIENMSPTLARAGTISFGGSFDGILSNFKAEGHLATNQGAVEANLRFMPTAGGGIHFVGNMNTEKFDVGTLTDIPDLGNVVLDANVDAIVVKNNVTLKTNASIDEVFYRGYNYKDIDMNGSFENQVFNGTVTVRDKNLDFTTTGKFDFLEEIPSYNFDMTLSHADLYALGLNKRDSVSLLAAKFRAFATGNTLDNINGTAEVDSLFYMNPTDTVRIGTIRLEAQNNETLKQITMTSPFADIQMRGRNSYRNILPYMEQLFAQYMPSIPAASELTGLATSRSSQPVAISAEVPFDDGYYLLTVNVKEVNNVAAIFVPGLEVSDSTSLNFFFNPYLNQFNFNLNSEYIQKGSFYVEDLNTDIRNIADSLAIYVSSGLLSFATADLPNFSIIGGIKNNRITIGSRFSNPQTGTQALINTTTAIRRTESGIPQFDIRFHPSSMALNNKAWLINENHVLIDTTGITVQDLRVTGSGQQLYVNGKAGRSTSDTLVVGMHNLDISPASSLVANMGYQLGGKATGAVRVISVLKGMQMFASVKIADMKMNEHNLGNPLIESNWDSNSSGVIALKVTNDKGEKPVTARYNLEKKRYRADFKFPQFDLALLEPIFQGVVAKTEGLAAVDLHLTGGPGTPTLNGTVDIANWDMTVDFTRARYRTSGMVNVKDNRFTLEGAPLSDFNGGRGTINGFLDSKYFKDITYGVNARFEDLLALNTTLRDNSDFYGRAYGTGSLNIEGYRTSTKMSIVAETARNSEFVLPFSDVQTISEADFIRFIDPNAVRQPVNQSTRRKHELQEQRATRRRSRVPSLLEIDIDLHVLPNTQAQIILDPSTGDMLRGTGQGNFNMRIVPSQDVFTMTGPFTIQQGSYHFVQAIIDKWFTIQPNSMIRWTGDPANPDMNIDVSYRVKTSLAPLTGGNLGSSNTATILCGINLSDKLRNPAIRLGVTAPTADPEIQNVIRNLLNTEEAVSMQFIALLSAGVFIPDMGAAAIGTMSGSLASATGFEFLSNQISNMISSDKYNLRLGYRPGDNQTTPEEFNFDFGTDLIENKLTLELGGNYNVGNLPTVNQRTPFTGDAYLTWILNKSGNLRLKGFTRVIDRFDETQGLQESGVGVYFRQDFQNLRDLINRYHATLDRVRKKKQERKIRKGRIESPAENTPAPIEFTTED